MTVGEEEATGHVIGEEVRPVDVEMAMGEEEATGYVIGKRNCNFLLKKWFKNKEGSQPGLNKVCGCAAGSWQWEKDVVWGFFYSF